MERDNSGFCNCQKWELYEDEFSFEIINYFFTIENLIEKVFDDSYLNCLFLSGKSPFNLCLEKWRKMMKKFLKKWSFEEINVPKRVEITQARKIDGNNLTNF